MKSKIGAAIALLLFANNNEVNALRIAHQNKQQEKSEGIFGKMIE
jgi:hypothetical protein